MKIIKLNRFVKSVKKTYCIFNFYIVDMLTTIMEEEERIGVINAKKIC